MKRQVNFYHIFHPTIDLVNININSSFTYTFLHIKKNENNILKLNTNFKQPKSTKTSTRQQYPPQQLQPNHHYYLYNLYDPHYFYYAGYARHLDVTLNTQTNKTNHHLLKAAMEGRLHKPKL